MQVDYLIIGSGLTGATIGRLLKDARKDVLIVDRRSHFGGNVHDHSHESGIRIHTYGPHYFRTSSEKLWEFVNRFATFYKYEAALKSMVGGKLENWPIAGSYLKALVGDDWKPSFVGEPKNFEEASLSLMPRQVYESFVKGYSEKQWGVPATALSPDLAKRFDVHTDDDPRLMSHKYQGIPVKGYTDMMSKILHDIPLLMNYDFLSNRETITAKKMTIFTGPIDEFFAFDQGKLVYRSQKREHTYFSDIDYKQACGQINNPSPENGDYIRSLEWKHMMEPKYAEKISGTVVTTETPFTPADPEQYEYPFPDAANANLFASYKARAEKIPNLLICGRLGEYRYYDMDQAIARAMLLAERMT